MAANVLWVPGDVAEIAMLKENNAALWRRVQEPESQVPSALVDSWHAFLLALIPVP
jgi:hypothetical protein